MAQWIPVARVDECPPGTALERCANDQIIALFNVDGQFYAMDGVCPHQGGPLGKGTLTGCTLTCPWHGWQFNVTDGRHKLSARIVQPTFPVRVEAGAILIELP
jgi:nitrite reductase (NADH) small subunit